MTRAQPGYTMRRRFLDALREVWKAPFLEALLLRATRGRTFGTMATRLPPNHYQYPKGTRRQVTRDGIRYSLDISDLVDWYIFYGFLEPSRERLYRLACEGDTVLDVGANVGDTSLHLARRVGPMGAVHSFEPDPTTFERLSLNASLNSFRNLHLNRKALGDAPGRAALYTVDARNRGMNRILETALAAPHSTVEVLTLDEYVAARCLSAVDLVKLDVEGYELRVLSGATQTLASHHPRLFVEIDDGNLRAHGDSPQELVALLEECGYALWHADTGEPLRDSCDLTGCHFDLIASWAPRSAEPRAAPSGDR